MDNLFLLQDRIQKIQQINAEYNLLEKSYLAFSGGKDSSVVHKLLDLALPNNKIPRVYSNTGVEHKMMVDFVKKLQEKDKRILILPPSVNIKEMLQNYGYPFKSKEFAHILHIYQNSGNTISVQKFTRQIPTKRKVYCSTQLLPCFSESFTLKVSDACCNHLKKYPMTRWSKEHEKNIRITGMRYAEGGQRIRIKGCFGQDAKHKQNTFAPILPMSDDWLNWFIEKFDVPLCDLYKPPYNMTRTGCRGCPFSFYLDRDLQMMKELLPTDFKACWELWRPVYEQYLSLRYRLSDKSKMA